MYRSKLDYILMPEKDESTNAMSHYTNGKIRGIYSSRVRSNHTIVPGDNLVMRDGKYEHFVEKFNMNTAQQIESLKSLPDPSTFKYILTGHYGVAKQ